MYRSSLRFAAIALVLALAARTARSQTTWYVDAQGIPPGSGTVSDPYTDLADALGRATTLDGDTVLVRPGNYGPISFSKALTVRSTDGPAVTRILGHANFGTGNFVFDSLLAGFTIEGRVSMVSAAIDQCAVVWLSQNPSGDGIFFDYGTSITRCTIAGFSGGIQQFDLDTGDVLIENTIVLGTGTDISLSSTGTTGVGAIRYCRYASLVGRVGFSVRRQHPCRPGALGSGPRLRPAEARLALRRHRRSGGAARRRRLADRNGCVHVRIDLRPRPTSYCTAKPNSLGCLPDIGHQGLRVTSRTLFVRATQIVPNKLGFLFYGTGEAAAPLQGGTRCVGAPFKRTPASNSGSSGQLPCSGVLTYDFNARIRSGADPALVPGRMVYAQYYYRDPADPTGFGTGLSDGLRFGIAP